MRRAGIVLALSLALVLGACGERLDPAKKVAGDGDAKRGRQVYLAQCTACHAGDPAKDGPLGPAVKGASRELLEARILYGSYPPGYTPKRASALMQPVPALKANIPDLAAFLR